MASMNTLKPLQPMSNSSLSNLLVQALDPMLCLEGRLTAAWLAHPFLLLLLFNLSPPPLLLSLDTLRASVQRKTVSAPRLRKSLRKPRQDRCAHKPPSAVGFGWSKFILQGMNVLLEAACFYGGESSHTQPKKDQGTKMPGCE